MKINKHRIGYSVTAVIALLIGAGKVTVTASTPTAAAAITAPSACKQLREAFLHGDEAGITARMKAIAEDKTTNDTAREYAGYYANRDAANKSAQEKEIQIIQFYCSF